MSRHGSHGDGNGDGDGLHDPHLRRALDHAPDHGDRPAARTQDAILKLARDRAATPVAPVTGGVSWWRRTLGLSAAGPRMPWSATFATVLVAGFVTVLWRMDPAAERLAEDAAPVETVLVERAPVDEARVGQATPPAPAVPALPARSVPRVAPVMPDAPDAAGASSAHEAEPDRALARAPVRRAPALTPPDIAEASSAPLARARRQEEAPSAPTADASGSAGAAPMAPRAAPRPGGDVRAARAAVQAAPAPNSFTALEFWTSVSGGDAGSGARLLRGDREGLPALLSAAARSATVPGTSLSAPVEQRVELYRGPTLVAVLEIAGDEVRWTPQPSGTAFTGTLPQTVRQALRTSLQR